METNVIYNEDCLDTMNKLNDKSVDLIVTDPPYLMQYKTNYRKNKNHEFTNEILNSNNEQLIKDYIKNCYRILKDDSAIYIFSGETKIDFFKKEIEKYFNIKNIIVWVKNNHTAGDLEAAYGRQKELLIYANKGRSKINGKRITDVWYFDKVAGDNLIHQNQKPINLIKRCIKKSSNKNDVVFDGFMGSGTTAIASQLLERKFIGSELSNDKWRKAIERIGKLDKKYYNILPEEEQPAQQQLF